jgi:acyl carrier protein
MKTLEQSLIQLIQLHQAKDDLVITKETNFSDDLRMDSLEIVELIIEIEKNFGIQIPDEEIESSQTFGDLLKYMESLDTLKIPAEVKLNN